MAFTPVKYDDGQTDELPITAGVTVAKGDALAWASGYLQRATSATTEVKYIALEGVVDSDSEAPRVLVLNIKGVEIIADTNTAPVRATDVGVKADLTDHDTLNESASDNDVFEIVDIVGATSDKKVRGYFVSKTS